ncbi:MAG: CDP-alcohol phosphatidyltransferase family protein, partial [Flavobacteriales bacterium]
NFFILLTIWHITEGGLLYTFLAFVGLQLQGTLYNYYYVILRNQNNGDITSRIFEDKVPVALKGEKQRNVNILFAIYK